MEEEMPSMSDVAKANNMELNEIMENAARSMEDLIQRAGNITHARAFGIG